MSPEFIHDYVGPLVFIVVILLLTVVPALVMARYGATKDGE